MPHNVPDKNLRVLVMDESLQRAEMLESAVQSIGGHVIRLLATGDDLVEAVTSFKPDIIFIEVDSPTRDTLEQLTTVRERMPRPVVMFCQDQSYQTIESAIQSGVSAYVTDGTDPEHVRPAIATAMATFASFQHLRQELDETKDSLQERKLVERAKGKLMREKGWSEDRAYQVLRKTAMNRKTRLAEVSQAVLAGSLS